jgi:hypothetical protein
MSLSSLLSSMGAGFVEGTYAKFSSSTLVDTKKCDIDSSPAIGASTLPLAHCCIIRFLFTGGPRMG